MLWTNSQCGTRNDRRKREFSNRDYNYGAACYKDLWGLNKVLLLVHEHGDLSFLFQHLSSYNISNQ